MIHVAAVGSSAGLFLPEIPSLFPIPIPSNENLSGYFSKFAGISKWKQLAVANARANKLDRTKIGRIISVPDNATITSLFCLPVQTNGADAFKLALCLISRGLQGVDARIVDTL